MFLFVKARIATDDEGVLPFPRDLHKISIPEATREKYRRVTRAHDESLLLKPALLALTYVAENITKEKSLFSRLGPISRLRPAFPPCFIPLVLRRVFSIHPRVRDLCRALRLRVFAIYSVLFPSLNPRLTLLLLAPRRSRNRSVSFAISRDSLLARTTD